MSIPLRIEYPGTLHHVTWRWNEKKQYLRTNKVEKNSSDILKINGNLQYRSI